MSQDENAGGLAINWQMFGSNGQVKADYSRGVLERFTRRAPSNWSRGMGNHLVKTLANPRTVAKYGHPHYPNYFKNLYSVNENGKIVPSPMHSNKPVTVEKIALNHYFTKSREEFLKKISRGRADIDEIRPISQFDSYDRNDEFDDSILKYRDARAKVYQPPKPRSADNLLKALERNLSPTFSPDTPPKFYVGKMETFLTCRAVSSYLQTNLANDSLNELLFTVVSKSLEQMNLADAQIFIRGLPKLLNLPDPVFKNVQAKFFEEASLKAILKALKNSPSEADKELLKLELPKILELPYPAIKEFLKQMVDARIDIKLMTTTGDFQILSVSDDKATVWKPGWFQKGGIGYQIQSNVGNMKIVAKATTDGKISLNLRGIDVRDSADNSKRIPYWIDYTKLIVNGKVILDKLTPAWHDKAFIYRMDAKANDEIKIQVEWQPHRSDN